MPITINRLSRSLVTQRIKHVRSLKIETWVQYLVSQCSCVVNLQYAGSKVKLDEFHNENLHRIWGTVTYPDFHTLVFHYNRTIDLPQISGYITTQALDLARQVCIKWLGRFLHEPSPDETVPRSSQPTHDPRVGSYQRIPIVSSDFYSVTPTPSNFTDALVDVASEADGEYPEFEPMDDEPEEAPRPRPEADESLQDAFESLVLPFPNTYITNTDGYTYTATGRIRIEGGTPNAMP